MSLNIYSLIQFCNSLKLIHTFYFLTYASKTYVLVEKQISISTDMLEKWDPVLGPQDPRDLRDPWDSRDSETLGTPGTSSTK